MNYYVMIKGQYVDQITADGYGTTAYEEDALLLDYTEATNVCANLVKQTGQVDFCEMVEAYEKYDEDEVEERDDRDEFDKRGDAMAERADDSRDDR